MHCLHVHTALLSLRIDQPLSNCCSQETLLNFGLQCFHVSTCYYHQDLHQKLLYSSFRQEVRSKPECPPTNCAINLRSWSNWQLNCCTLLRGFPLPRPPPCCYNEPTPLTVSDKRALEHLNPMLGSSLIASSASVYGHVELSLFPEVHQSNRWILPTDSSRIGREQHVPESSNRSLYLIKLRRSSYPEGNFGWNQRLDSSISLPPLHPSVTNDLRVNSVTASTRVSLDDCPSHVCFTIFRVRQLTPRLKPLSRSRSVAKAHIQTFTSITLAG